MHAILRFLQNRHARFFLCFVFCAPWFRPCNDLSDRRDLVEDEQVEELGVSGKIMVAS